MRNTKIYKERIQRWINTLGEKVYTDGVVLKAEYVHDKINPIPYSELDKHQWQEIKIGDKWSEVWGCGWFHLTGQVEKRMRGEYVGVWVDVDGEACLYRDGVPYQGLTNKIDWNLQAGKYFIPLYPDSSGNEEIDLLLETGANGLFGKDKDSYFLKKAEIVVYHPDYYKLWMDVRTLFNLWEGLPDGSPRKKKILAKLNSAANVYGGGIGLSKALEYTQELLKFPANASDCTAWSVGHAHIDVAWLWPLRETRRKANRTYATALRFIEEYPEYIFGGSQPQLYEYVKEDHPKLYEEIKKAVAAGRWECQGATWVEMDTNLPSGESLIRQCIYGKRFFKEEFDKDIDFLWLPDCFGYTGSLPQIFKKSGVDVFISQKLSWNDTNQFSHHTYRWQGIDGTEILCHFLPTNDYNLANLPTQLIASQERFAQADVSDDFLNLYGIGDGGGGPSKEHIELGLRQQNLEGTPKFKFSTAKDFINKIKQIDKEDLPIWLGELYFELHRGTYTTQGKMKRYNRFLENKMQLVEFLSVIAKKNINMELRNIWKGILLNQFHDIIPGSSIGWVYKDAYKLSEENLDKLALLQDMLESVIITGENKEKKMVLINSLSHERKEVIEIQADKNYSLFDGDNEIPTTYEDKILYAQVRVPAMGYVCYTLQEKNDIPEISYPDNHDLLENDLIKVTFGKTGEITSIYDRELGEEWLLSGANMLKLYEDKPNNWFAWDINHFYRETEPEVPELMNREVIFNNDLKKTIYQKLMIGHSTVEQMISIFKDSKEIRIENKVEWLEEHKMLRVSCEPRLFAMNAVSEIQFGLLDRPCHKNTSWDWAKFEVLAHTFIDKSDANKGFAVLNDCKYGHSVQDNMLEINLLRSPADVDPEADLGHHEFTYSYYPHTKGLRDSDVVRVAHQLNQPIDVVVAEIDLPKNKESFFSVSDNNVIINGVKYAEASDDVVLRMYESMGGTSTVKLRIPTEYSKAFECDNIENDIKALTIKDGEIIIKFKPFEIKSIKLR